MTNDDKPGSSTEETEPSSRSSQNLAHTIKSLHRRLRHQYQQTSDADTVWELHCQDKNALKEYAECMHQLATEHWEVLSSSDPSTSRINWARNVLHHYYLDGGLEDQRKKMNTVTSQSWTEVNLDNKIRVLDVGSCYNPFGEFEELNVLPIDLCPAKQSVFQCDFLRLSVEENTSVNLITDGRVEALAADQFHGIVFSFLLEYFPSPEHRWTCCLKAQQLLVLEGLLLLITPDSKAAHSNYRMINSWRDALASIGLKRIKYDKLQHAHCMAFRKTSKLEDLGLLNHHQLAAMMYIPQDSQDLLDETDGAQQPNVPRLPDEELVEGFSQLPSLFTEEDDD